jgi:hypothetical protein
MDLTLCDIFDLEALEYYALTSKSTSTRKDRLKCFTAYMALREKITTDFLHLITSREPYMNDHSKDHLKRVLCHVESILEHNFPKQNGKISDIPVERTISWVDTIILLNALIWHDLGNIYGRKGHAVKVRECFDQISPYLYDSHLCDCIIQVAEAHSGEGAIEKSIPQSLSVTSYLGETIHLQFLSAVLRFADEIDEDCRRAKPNEWEHLNIIPEENRKYWYFSKINSSVKINSEPGDFSLNYWVDIVSHLPSGEFDKKFKFNHSDTNACTDYFRRILKFESERKYCNQYLQTFYHPGIKGFRITLKTHEKDTAPASGRVYDFEISNEKHLDSYCYDESFNDLKPFIEEALIERIK